MRLALILLTFGTLTSWRLAGGLNQLLSLTLPFHHLEVESTMTIVERVASSASTWVALGVIMLGMGSWFLRDRVSAVWRKIKPLLVGGFGFDELNRGIVSMTDRAAQLLQATQTGQVNWNILGILMGLCLVLLLLAGGVR